MDTNAFTWDQKREPHFERRKKIINEFPEVKKLFGVDRLLAFKVLFVVLLQLAIPVFFLPENPILFVFLLFVVGATLAQILFLAVHELSHNLASRKEPVNNILSLITNFPLVFPYAMAFKVYHLEHHWHQGKEGVDTDIPSEQEAMLFRGFMGKFVWMVSQILFYALRPMFVRPLRPNRWMVINAAVQVLFMIGFYFVAGWYGILYLILSIFIAGGLHPMSGHFIAEHFVFVEGQETYSYYGPLNKLTFNVGYHNEHHDFPNVPGSRLPELKRIANKHYENLHSYDSWSRVMFDFITNNSVSLFSRVKRKS